MDLIETQISADLRGPFLILTSEFQIPLYNSSRKYARTWVKKELQLKDRFLAGLQPQSPLKGQQRHLDLVVRGRAGGHMLEP